MHALVNVLIVDDDPDNADSLAMLLRSAGYAAEAVYDGSRALAAAQERCPRIVFIDAAMPKMDGFALARRLRQVPHMADAVIVCLTGFAGRDYQQKAREAGCDLFLPKPASPEKLLHFVASVAAGRRPAASGRP